MHAAAKNSPLMLLAPLLIVLVYFTDTGYSIMCYECNSAYDPRCGDNFDAFSIAIVNCSLKTPLEHINVTESTLCRKVIQRVYGVTRVVRKCGYISDSKYDNNKRCLRRTGTHDVLTYFCSCTGDLCNGATRQQTSNFATMFIPFVMAALIRL